MTPQSVPEDHVLQYNPSKGWADVVKSQNYVYNYNSSASEIQIMNSDYEYKTKLLYT